MQELVELSVKLHIWFSYIFIAFSALSLALVNTNKHSNSYIKRIRLLFPIYYLAFSCILFTGFLLLAVVKFELNIYVFLMILAWIFILATSIVNYKKFKLFIQKNKAKEFVSFATSKYLSEILILLAFLVF